MCVQGGVGGKGGCVEGLVGLWVGCVRGLERETGILGGGEGHVA